MNQPTHTPDRQQTLERIRQLFTLATHEASAAMSRWTQGAITLELETVQEVPLERAIDQLGLGEELLTMVVLTMDDELGGSIILCFDEENGRKLAATLLRRPLEPSAEWTELEQSALTETGNILGCAYMNAINRVVSRELVPSPPFFIQDYGASVLQQALMEQALYSPEVLLCRTRFLQEQQQLNWHVILVPTQELRELFESALLAPAERPGSCGTKKS